MSSIPKPTRYLNYAPNNQNCQDGQSDSETDLSTSTENLSHDERYSMRNMPRQEPQGQETRGSQDSTYNTLIIHDESRIPTRKVQGMNSSNYKNHLQKEQKCVAVQSVREINNIPDDYLSQSQVLKHLAKEVKGSEDKSTGWRNESRMSMRHLSKSQPDLSRLSNLQYYNFQNTMGDSVKEQRCMQMVDLVLQENNNLKLELEHCYQRVKKSLKLEEEIAKVHRGHEELVASCERREKLERAARTRLQAEVRRLQDANRALREQAEVLSSHAHSSQFVDVSEITKREAIIAQLIAQNKELGAAKERQEIELAAQRATLEEQRTHIDILDTALTNAQGNVVRLEEECRKKQIHVERVAQLQRALSSLQLASDRREQTERKLRLQLEQELRNERARNTQNTSGLGVEFEPGESLPELKRRLREKDEKIMRLEGEVSKWEQRYLEESELRQAAIDAASIPKDAKIAALEKTSQESEKLIAEARSDKIRQMDEVHAAQKKVTELESRMKELESKLAERDAMIRVLQKKHTIDKEVVSGSYPSISLSHHTQHSSLNTSDLSNVLTADDLGPVSTGVFSTVSSVLTSSTGFDSSTSYTGSVDSAFHHRRDKYSSANQSFDFKSVDDQLKELDSQILSKASLIQALRREKEKYPNHYYQV